MTKALRSVLVLVMAVGGCSGNAKTGGTGGVSPGGSGGTGGTAADGGSGGSVTPPSGSTGGATTGGTVGTGSGGSGEGGSGEPPDAAVTPPATDASSSNVEGGAPQPSSMGHEGSISWYEAEDGMLFGRAQKSKCTACPSRATMKAGDSCCSGGGEVTWIVAAKTSDLQLNGITAPADGMYDVTFWYYCGNNDNFNDNDCGGQTNPPTMKPAGCRPHQFIVNGTTMPGAYHFPCFGGAWSIVRTATVSMTLKAGPNTIRMHAPPPRDCVNLDGIELYPPGKGQQPLIMSNPDLTGH
jgi:hypothetical protein